MCWSVVFISFFFPSRQHQVAMTFLLNGFRSWNCQQAQTLKEQTDSARRFRISMAAETSIEKVLQNCGYVAFMNRRIWNEAAGCRREIDLITVTDDYILVIECKNWVGSVWRNGVKWYQLPKEDARALQFEDVYGENVKKAKLLHEHLIKDCKCDIDEKSIIPVVVFTHPKVKLDPKSVSNMPNVFTMERFIQWLQPSAAKQATTWWGTLTSMLPAFITGNSGPKLSLAQKTKVEKALGLARTWDSVILHNGTLLNGDIISVEVVSSDVSVARNLIYDVTVEWAANTLWGMCASMWAGSAGHLILKMRRRKGAPKEPVRVPIKVSYAKNFDKVDRIIFRSAGKPHNDIIPLAKIKSIRFGAEWAPKAAS